jgi:hypothetical protein
VATEKPESMLASLLRAPNDIDDWLCDAPAPLEQVAAVVLPGIGDFHADYLTIQ